MRLIDGALSLSSCFCVASFCCASSFHSASAGSSSPRETVSVSPESNRGGVRGVSPSSHSLYTPPLALRLSPELPPTPRPCDSAAASARAKGARQGNAARGARQGECGKESAARGARAPSSSQLAIKYSTSPSVATMCMNPRVFPMISFIMESTSTRSRLPDCGKVGREGRAVRGRGRWRGRCVGGVGGVGGMGGVGGVGGATEQVKRCWCCRHCRRCRRGTGGGGAGEGSASRTSSLSCFMNMSSSVSFWRIYASNR